MMRLSLALAQHPMYFLIKEDTGCAERTPPWGAPNVEEYAERLERNLDSLERYPECRFGYEWSAYELELLSREFPDVFAKMRDLGGRGRTAFYNGTYSQPHLQTLSSESCYRQFEYGMAAYRELGLRLPVTYAHQEASVHDQVPQLLSAFGLRFAVIPGFSSTLEWLEGGELTVRWGDGLKFVRGAEFTRWIGLDGTEVPLYLINTDIRGPMENAVAVETMQGLMAGPALMVSVPDLIEVDDRWINERKDVDLVLLDDALARRIREVPPVGRTRFHTNWSYIEGIRAEELSRADSAAGIALLRAEAMGVLARVLIGRAPETLRDSWKTVLACQHHDVYCFCAPELKGKAVGWLSEVRAGTDRISADAMEAVAAEIDIPPASAGAVAVFNPAPYPVSAVVGTVVQAPISELLDPSGAAVPFDTEERDDGSVGILFPARVDGLGYAAYRFKAGPAPSIVKPRSWEAPFAFENRFYAARIEADGTFSSLTEAVSGAELLDPSSFPGNNLAGTDSEGLSPRGTALGREGQWVRPERGPELTWKPDGAAVITEGAASTTLRISGSLGRRIGGTVELRFYPDSPRIDIIWTLDFDEASVGNFYEDDTKLRIRWPLAFDGTVSHDIAFGVADERNGRPFTPSECGGTTG